MATIHLRDVPGDLDAALTAEARRQGVSKSRCAIDALRRGLSAGGLERSRLVDEIRRGRRELDVDIAALIRGGRRDGGA